MTWRPAGRTWQLLDESGAVLATLEHDATIGQYRDANGRCWGSMWYKARDKCQEDAVKKGKS